MYSSSQGDDGGYESDGKHDANVRRTGSRS